MTFDTQTPESNDPLTGRNRSALILGDETTVRNAAFKFLKQAGFEVEMVANGEMAAARVEQKAFSLVMVDADLKTFSGLEVLERIKQLSPHSNVILTTSSPEIDQAVDAIRMGAVDYMTKPVDTEKLAARIRHFDDQTPQECARGLRGDGAEISNKTFITRNAKIQQLLDAAARVAGTRATILITGESGTGKEVLATHIHQAAGRPERPFVAVNCAALPETLIESELFGHEKGAFTGAAQRRAGKFEQVGEGTLVLDEIGDMPLVLQPKILRILQERRIERLGGGVYRPFKGQVIAITNQDLGAAVKEGRFREDLYYRINVVPFHLPPLRARQDDIPILVRHFLTKYAARYEKALEPVDSKMLVHMSREEWRGNVRELENRIERAVLMSPGPRLDVEFLGDARQVAQPRDEDAVIRAGLSVRGMEKILIGKTMQAVNQNRAKASELLGISVRTLRNKLNQYQAGQAATKREALS